MYSPESAHVLINESRFLRHWNDVGGEFGALFIPDAGPVDNDAVRTAIDGVRGPHRPDKPFSVCPLGDGFALLLNPSGTRAEVRRLLTELARALEDAGLGGLLTSRYDTLARRGERYPAPSFTAVACFTGAAIRLGEPPEYAVRPGPYTVRWTINSPDFQYLVQQVLVWARDATDGRYLVSSGMLSSFCREDQVADFITLACGNIGYASLEVRAEDGRLFLAQFGSDGYLFLHAKTEGMTWHDLVSDMAARLSEMAPSIDYGLILRSFYGANSMDAANNFGRAQPKYLGGDYRSSHYALKEMVTDVFGVQVLGPGHPDLHPPGEWQIRDLPGGRRLVCSNRLEEWYAEEYPEPSVIDAARTENEGMLFTFERWQARDWQAHDYHEPR
jgi:hypothetical protein